MSAKLHYFDISQLPSVRDGMSAREEAQKRLKTVRFIEETCRLLKLPRVAVATAAVFFHRFYAKHAFQTHDRFEVAVAAIVLAAKTEESPKRVATVIEEASKLKFRSLQSGRISQAGLDGAAAPPEASQFGTTAALDPKSEEFAKLKERVLLLERVILHTIGFELSVTHPYKYIVEITKRAINKKQIEFIAPEEHAEKQSSTQVQQSLTNKVVQVAMNFANDSLQTSLCLQAGPEKIAVACVFLAFQFAGVRPTQDRTWLDVLGHPDVELLITVALQIVDLVVERKGVDQATFARIRAVLDQMRDDDAAGVAAEERAAKRSRVE